ncbi:MAG: hypothetical protein A2268_02375 [Candidatus Raymondbacteria bacterium RifOxyA12_full_50_37]|uniref:Response regulatory domain-containing protein n=1 Tax=Candidatus Raymondbacteria bacterium RIFOXYD12_FULL_49_13 TaxID=1817890 RepID=A0A1F7FM42_UNCRA|nr:MAG: hypothetical protein A2248_15950 [Candidatus Raymondbacteria bacterium RIFOXYA2_FULL_49_16]OGJ90598.1 MAG: hypothetical protein A2268_02375 [Candidatus Raymondbacteria bacterium RifOxyA12_full_50_37]OGJ98716.1 MAG: hypothetical protein A2487_15990 [Candidatus Raymondbacteria bacterium RifOxyC12_full_50_8]OGJ99421.1 MAG: hypothetical protein A2453_05390 [Candidatus Raymondbacteria bacterium RIFOXYC2_FULL_50_21]OGJ99600.1 MAG: hypothetical protein A2350_06165 [Candidatus Raymondbacteria b
MRTLIVEDEFTSRKILMKIMAAFGQCDIAVNGKEAIEAFCLAHEERRPYHVICLDILMPEMDGRETLQRIRSIEKKQGIEGLDGVKVVMITGCSDKEEIFSAFQEGCEAYIVKPVQQEKLVQEIKKLGLV